MRTVKLIILVFLALSFIEYNGINARAQSLAQQINYDALTSSADIQNLINEIKVSISNTQAKIREYQSQQAGDVGEAAGNAVAIVAGEQYINQCNDALRELYRRLQIVRQNEQQQKAQQQAQQQKAQQQAQKRNSQKNKNRRTQTNDDSDAIRRQQEANARAKQRQEEIARQNAEREERERRRAEEYNKNYNEEMQRTASRTNDLKTRADYMSSDEAIDAMTNMVNRNKRNYSDESVRNNTPIGNSGGIKNLKKRRDRNRSHIVMDYISKLDYDFYYSLLLGIDNLHSLLGEKFRELSQNGGSGGFDIEAILKKNRSEWSNEEKQIVSNYNEFVRLALKEAIVVAENKIREKDLDKDKRLVDAAITSALSYNKEKYYAYYQQTDYRPIDRSLIERNDVINVLIDALDYCNSTEGDTGFHAELYKNAITGEYMLAFQGSTDPSDFLSLDIKTLKGAIADWLHNNIPNGLNDFFSENSNVGNFIKKAYENTFGGFDKPQFIMAASLAIAMNSIGDRADINISGHSLGGGLAGYVGLLTDRQTYMFNPEGLGQDLIRGQEIGNNFHVVITDGEPLTDMQEFGERLKRAMNNKDSDVFMVVPGKTGDSKVSNPNSTSHSIEDLVDYQIRTISAQREWKDLKMAQISFGFLSQYDSGLYVKEAGSK